MPNGRTGGFRISREELEHLLANLPPQTDIGTEDDNRPMTAAGALALLRKFKQEIAIEEQHHEWYIIHLSPWISVDNTSELHAQLRACHARSLVRSSPAYGAATNLRKSWDRIRDTDHGPVIAVKFSGVYPSGSEGNAFAVEMVDFLCSVFTETRASAVIFDFTQLDYTWGDAIALIPLALRLGANTFRPAAIVARGETARSLQPLLTKNSVMGVAGIDLFDTVESALASVESTLLQRPSAPRRQAKTTDSAAGLREISSDEPSHRDSEERPEKREGLWYAFEDQFQLMIVGAFFGALAALLFWLATIFRIEVLKALSIWSGVCGLFLIAWGIVPLLVWIILFVIAEVLHARRWR